ncbi:MAG: TonB-dependent receptor [Rhodospirillaceae bacterium]|nr:TonB-dependent receptor [Rhodospirillaceae bacterium]
MFKKLLLGSTIVSITASSTIALAQQQQAQTEPSGGLEEIVVTAERREASLQSVPIAVSAFSADALAKRQITQASDLERYVPSLKMRNNITSPTNLSPSLRGSLQQDASLIVAESPFGIYVDDVYLGRLNGNNVTLADIERVEVLRGPQGTLYGRNTLAGAIKFITRAPDQDNEWFNAEAGYGNFKNYKASFSAGGGVSDTVAGSVAAQIIGKNGYWFNRATSEDVGEEDNVAARGKLRYTGSDNFDASISLSHTRSTNDALQLTPATTPGVASNRQYRSRDVRPLFGDPYVVSRPVSVKSPAPITNEPAGKTKQYIASLNMTYDFGDASLQSITAFVNTNDFFSTDFTGTGGVPFAAGAANGGNLGGVVGATKLNSDQFTQEIKLQGQAVDSKLNYLVGAFYLYETGNQRFGWAIPGPFSTSQMQILTRSYSVFTHNDFAVSEDLKITAGVRYVKDLKKFDIQFQYVPPLNTILPAQAPVALKNTYDKWLPKFGLDYSVPTSGEVDSLLLYASLGRGFKSGGYSAIAIGNLNDARTPYGPESNWTYEGGVKGEFFDNRLRANAAYFYNRISDLTLNAQVPGVGGGPASFPVQNAGAATIKGLEAEFSAVPVDGLTLFVNSAFLSGKFRSLRPGSAPTNALANFGVANAKPPQLPDYSVTVGFDYRVDMAVGSRDGQFLIGADVYKTDDFITSATNEFILDGYSRIGAFVGVGIDEQWEVKLSVKNLADKETISTGARGFLGGFLYLPPREYMLTVKYSM